MESTNEKLAVKNLKLATNLAILSLITTSVFLVLMIIDGINFTSSDDWETIVIVASVGGIAPMVLVIIFTSVARAQLATDFKIMLGMSIPSLALAAFATAITILGTARSISMLRSLGFWYTPGEPEYIARAVLYRIGLGVLCTASVMDVLQIPLGIKDIVIGAGFIEAKRSKHGSTTFNRSQVAPITPTASPSATGPFCSNCGAKNEPSARFCNKCGGALG